MKTIRRWMYKNWAAYCGLLGSAFYVAFYFALPPAARTREVCVALLMLCLTITSGLMKAHPRPEWATGRAAKGRPN